MSYRPRDLNLAYEPAKGWAHFVLYTEPRHGVAYGALNGTASIEQVTPYVREWLGRLQRCEPNALHTTLVPADKIPDLFHPCVYDDKDSPSAVGGSGCVCHQTFLDPEFGLPVVAEHYRTVSGNIDSWKYLTYTPLDLRPQDSFASLALAGDQFWARTTGGLLVLLPEEHGHGYGVGYSGGGPYELAGYISRLVESGGKDTAADSLRRSSDAPDPRILAWVSSQAAKRPQELTLEGLKRIQQGG